MSEVGRDYPFLIQQGERSRRRGAAHVLGEQRAFAALSTNGGLESGLCGHLNGNRHELHRHQVPMPDARHLADGSQRWTSAPTLTELCTCFAVATRGVLTLFVAAPPNGNSVCVRAV
jgi:hypothetical protein